jgi:hypothetical protein
MAQTVKHELTTSERIGIETLNSPDLQGTFAKWIGSPFRVALGRSFLGTISLARVETSYYPPRNRNVGAQLLRAGPIQPQPVQPHPVQPHPIQPQPIQPRPSNPFEIQAVMLGFKRAASYLPQDVYTLDHDWLGTFDLLLVPCARHSGQTSSTAVITRFPGQQPYVAD